MLENSDINRQKYSVEPYIITEDLSGVTKYTATSISFNDASKLIWKIKKEWKIDNIWYMGFPNGEQDFKFAWTGRTLYTYK